MDDDFSRSPRLVLFFRLCIMGLTIGPAIFVGVLLLYGFAPRAGEPLFGNFITHTAVWVSVLAVAINVVLCKVVAHYKRNVHANERGVRAELIYSFSGAIVFAFAAFFATVALLLEQSFGAVILAFAMIICVASRFPWK